MNEYMKRRNKMLTFYPEVASVGNLADALSRAFAEQGSALTAYSPVPPEKPTWSIFSDHPSAPGTTVPEAARVKTGKRACQVEIGCFEVPLGTFRLDFYDSYEWDEIGDLDCWIDTRDLVTAAHVIRRTFEENAELSDLAEEFGVEFHRRPRSEEEEAARDYRAMSEEERERFNERKRAREYEILGMSEDRVHQILDELTRRELYECIQQTKLDQRRHIRKNHPEEGRRPKTRSVEKMLNNIMLKLIDSPRESEANRALAEFVRISVVAYWSHVTEGHVGPEGSPEEYLISLVRRSRKAR